jgi:hypothetical protein
LAAAGCLVAGLAEAGGEDARAVEAAGTARVARVVSAASVIPARRIIGGLL